MGGYRTKINWTKTAHCLHANSSTLCQHSQRCFYGLSTKLTEGLGSSGWARSSSDSHQQQYMGARDSSHNPI